MSSTVRYFSMNVILSCLCILLVGMPSGFSQTSRRRTGQLGHRCDGVLYPGLGCFTQRFPFTNSQWLPQTPSLIRTTFFLYTQHNPTQAHILNPLNADSIRNTHFDSSRPVKILIHGFLQNGYVEFLRSMTQALLASSRINVIIVGWAGGAGFPYAQAVANTRVVGAETARLLLVMVRELGLSLEHVHLVGHSLGAHVAGYVGTRVPGLERITGLDPAQPNFSGYPPAVRLDTSDARFVDVIHTDGVPYDTIRGYGMVEPVGHVDFYPNGGREQPGCVDDTSVLDVVEDAFSRGVTRAESGMSCSHERSTALFTASVLHGRGPCVFTAFSCGSEDQFVRGECLHCGNRPCPEMGLHADSAYGLTGSFFLNTTATEPFCSYHHFVTLTLSDNTFDAEGTLSVRLVGSQGHTQWTQVKTGHLHAGEMVTVLILTGEDTGEIDAVNVRFREASSYFRWSSHQVTLAHLRVNCPMRFHTKYFCHSDMTLVGSGDLTLTNGSFNPDHCTHRLEDTPRS